MVMCFLLCGERNEADPDKLCGYGRWKPRPASYLFIRAIEGVYTICRNPVVQKEGINYLQLSV